jgi:hypothetical protein
MVEVKGIMINVVQGSEATLAMSALRGTHVHDNEVDVFS